MNYIKDHENLNDKKILLRLDLNVPLKNGVITDQTRIDKILPVIKFLLKKNSKIIIISHVGRPKGRVNKELSMKPILVEIFDPPIIQLTGFWISVVTFFNALISVSNCRPA